MDPLDQLFGPDGPLADRLDAYRPRSAQIELAKTIADCLDEGRDLVAEAATGVGKTLAYLLPVLLRPGKAIISTGTLNLQDQLFARDLPLALQATGVERSVALLKGRANYLCPHRLERAQGDDRITDPEIQDQLRIIGAWAERTVTGEIREVTQVPERSPVWPLVTSTVDNCLGHDCPRFQRCPVVRARRQAIDADLVVVNHHLLFADLALKQTGFGEVLPGADTIVADEAHQIPDIARRFFSRSVTAWQLTDLAQDALGATAEVPGSLHQLQRPVQQLKDALRQLGSRAWGLPERGEWSRLEGLHDELMDLLDRLRTLGSALEPMAQSSRELGSCHDRATQLGDTLELLLEGGHTDRVRWFSCRNGRLSLYWTPLDVAEPFAGLKRELRSTWIMTSATLAVGGRLDHFIATLGLEQPHTLVLPSPFDYAHQTRLWLPRGVPEPNAPDHTERLLRAVTPLLKANQGRAFLLFTSHRALRRAAEWLGEHTDFQLLIQEDAPRDQLLEAFRSAPGQLLLGAASFWEGVDVRGEALSVVVIDKLPFSAPDDPVLAAAIRAIRERGGNPFVNLQLPSAVIALKQGAGRLIRDPDDRGVLVVGDPRLRTRAYGRVFLDSLPPMPIITDQGEAIEFLTGAQ
ncbi:MAG: ATP-dependent DNA helicase [Wenzhouxiangellaceae bacterium]